VQNSIFGIIRIHVDFNVFACAAFFYESDMIVANIALNCIVWLALKYAGRLLKIGMITAGNFALIFSLNRSNGFIVCDGHGRLQKFSVRFDKIGNVAAVKTFRVFPIYHFFRVIISEDDSPKRIHRSLIKNFRCWP
jgi:hypothetical protein